MADYLNELARFAAETTFEDLSEEALSAARNVTLDTFGAISAGMEEPENLKLASWAADNMLPASAGILATPHRASPMAAALVNATAGVALEMDEGNRFGGGHPSIHVLPGLLAESERAGASGSEFITALVVGYEITSRLGGATSANPNVHSHGHWGAPGTAAAIARLRGWSVQDIRGAINVAASMSPANTWTNAFEGATVRNLYPGRSSMQGVLAVDLYQCGFTTLDDAPSDVYGSILGESFDPDQAVSGLGGEYRIQQNYFKLHACCRYNHATLDAVVDAVAGATIAPDDVESVTIGVPWMLDGMLGGYPQNMLAAKFNIPYAVAAALATGRTDISVFRPQTVADPSIRSLFDRVTVRVGDVQRQQAITGPGACVEIRTRGGGRLMAAVESIRGDYGSPIPDSDIVDKFTFLAEPVLGTNRTEDAVQRIDSLETVENMGSVVELFQVPR